MQKKLTNEKIYRYTKYRIFCWYMIIITGVLTIAFSLLSLLNKISPIFAVIAFLLEVIFTKLKEKFNTKEKE